MKLECFRIKNYKSIKDSGICYIQDTSTFFAGKNGSGKSNVLEALLKFTTRNFDFEEDNYNYEKDKPIIENKYMLSCDEIEYVKNKFNVDIGQEVEIILDTNDNKELEYNVKITIDTNNIEINNIEIIDKLKQEYDNPGLEYTNSLTELLGSFEQTYKPVVQLKLSDFVDIETLKQEIKEYILSNVPQFVYKKTIDNELKSVITQTSIKENDFHKDIAKLLGINGEYFDTNKDKSKRTRMANELSTELTGNFGNFYTQDKIELKFTLDGNSITMDVIEPDKASRYENKIENKSDGLRWFIAFYAKLNVTKSENVIILLDEPGMYLHAKACNEMLNIFDEISKDSQILLATHNPYLLRADNIGAIRLVLNDEKKSTVIQNKPYKYDQDKNFDALTPILTSIGYELTMSIHVGDQKNNLITEGISDYYFLQGMAKLLNIELDFLIIPSRSADKINYIASILIGWGLNTIALLDSDKKGEGIAEKLKPLVDKCMFVNDSKDNCIEDLFSKEDYCKKILELEEVAKEKNSKLKKSIGIDEVLKAKQFYDKTLNNQITLSTETKTNFKNLLNSIKKEFSQINK